MLNLIEMVKVADDSIDLLRGVDYIGVTVSFIIHDGKGNVLLQKRSQNTRDEQGRWDIGGGALEFSERLEDAVRREVREELGVDALDIKFLESGEAHRHNGNNPTHWIWLLHAAKVDPKLVKICEPYKIDEIGWFTSRNLPKPPHSMLETGIQIAKKHKIIK